MKPRLLLATLATIASALPAGAQQPASSVEFHGLVNVWLAAEDSFSTFRIRRTELKATGPITDALRWTVQADPSKVITLRRQFDEDGLSDVAVDLGSVLQDAVLSYQLRTGLFIDAGQYKLPIGREGRQSSSTLETVERALLGSARNKLSDVRGIGAQLRASLPHDVQLNAGVFNSIGEHLNRLDTNRDKALLARVTIPGVLMSGLSFGATGGVVVANASDATGGNRIGADLLYAGKRPMFKAEYLSGEDGNVERRGFYGLVAYKLHDNLEVAARYDEWDPDLDLEIDRATARERDYVAGLTYFLRGHAAKLQLNYIRKTFDRDIAPARGVAILNMQAAW